MMWVHVHWCLLWYKEKVLNNDLSLFFPLFFLDGASEIGELDLSGIDDSEIDRVSFKSFDRLLE